jgi:hypothetical protein
LISWFPVMLLRYFLNDSEIVSVTPLITAITFVFTFHMRCIYIVMSLYLRIVYSLLSCFLYHIAALLLPCIINNNNNNNNNILNLSLFTLSEANCRLTIWLSR